MTDTVSYEFGVASDAPPVERKGGPGRQRSNPFDGKVRASYDARWYQETDEMPSGKWYKILIKPDLFKRVEAQIRNAGTIQGIGTSIRHRAQKTDDGTVDGHDLTLDKEGIETGMEVVWFRGKPQDKRFNNGTANAVSSNDDADNENYED